MKRDKVLIIFISIAIIGLLIINLFFKDYFKGRQIQDTKGIKVSEGYKSSVAIKGLSNPSSFVFDKEGNVYIAENLASGGRIVKYTPKGEFSIVAESLSTPVSQIIINRNTLYISHRGKVSKVQNGVAKDIITGLPSFGDYSNNGITAGYDGMIYICQGAATNSGVVGYDNYKNGWLLNNPYFHDYPPYDLSLRGLNFKASNPLTSEKNDRATTGAFLPFNSPSVPEEVIKGRVPGNSSILRVFQDGTNMDVFAWGIRNPISLIITPDNKFYVNTTGMENRGSRPVANGRDYLYEVKKGMWLGWPDYEGGEAVTLSKFKPKRGNAPQFLTNLHPTTNLPKPIASFNEPGRMGIMDICRNGEFGMRNQIFIPFKKGVKEDAKVVAVDTKNNLISDFIINTDGSSFLKSPVQCGFSSDGNLYVLENSQGVLLKVYKEGETPTRIFPNYVPTEYLVGIIIISFIVYLVFSIRKQPRE